MTATGTFSWKRALEHAGLALLAAILVGAVILGLGIPDDVIMERAAEPVAQFSLLTFAVALYGSYVWQTGKRRQGLLLFVFVGALVVAAPVTAVVAAHSVRPSDEVRQDFALDATGARLVHPYLGLGVAALPAGFEPAHDLARSMVQSRGQVVWAWVDANSNASMFVTVDQAESGRGVGSELLDGVWTGLSDAASLEDRELVTETSTPDRRTGKLGAQSVGVRVISFVAGSDGYVAVVTVLDPDAAAVNSRLEAVSAR